MKIPNLQLTEITEALEDHGEHSWYWDKKAGEVLLNSDYDICGVSLEEQGFDEEPDENPDRYIYIEPLDSHQGFRNMEHYVGSLPEGECQRSLIRALRGRAPSHHSKTRFTISPTKDKPGLHFTMTGSLKKPSSSSKQMN
jgi:hypothetical protein